MLNVSRAMLWVRRGITRLAHRRMDENAFWTYSLDRYNRDGVPALCLTFQDEHHADVNTVLFALWLGQNGFVLNPASAELIRSAVQDWHQSVVAPLRKMRRWMKNYPAQDMDARNHLREAVKGLELEAERMEQDMLFGLFKDGTLSLDRQTGPVTAAMTSNLSMVCSAPTTLKNRLVSLCV